MSSVIKIGIIGDYEHQRPSHIATNEALKHCAQHLNLRIDVTWVPTESLDSNPDEILISFDGIWCAPGSPYKSMVGAMNGIHFARVNDYPFIGTCGGFQHSVVEYLQNQLGLIHVTNEEIDQSKIDTIITPLSCSLLNESRKIYIEENSKVHRIYNKTVVEERYNCQFGVNLGYQKILHEHGFHIAGKDESGDVRILELPSRRFYIATLFQPQLSSTSSNPHKLILEFLKAATDYSNQKRIN